MNVKELIDQLEKYPQDAIIYGDPQDAIIYGGPQEGSLLYEHLLSVGLLKVETLGICGVIISADDYE